MKIFTGKVISKKMEKTVTVAVSRIVVHPLYRKRFKKIKKYNVHDEIGVSVDQIVKFAASRPYSKIKKWRIVEVIRENRKPIAQKPKKTKSQRAQKKIKSTDKSVPST